MQKYYLENRSHFLLDKLAAYYSTSGLSKRAARLVLRAKYMRERKQKIASCSYSLHEPKKHTRELYVKIMKNKLTK